MWPANDPLADWETDAPEAPDPDREAQARDWFRYAYGFGAGLVFALALLLPPDLRPYGWAGAVGVMVYWPTFERSLQ